MMDMICDLIWDSIDAIMDFFIFYSHDWKRAKRGFLYRILASGSFILALLCFLLEGIFVTLLAVVFSAVCVYYSVKSHKYDRECLEEKSMTRMKQKAGKKETADLPEKDS